MQINRTKETEVGTDSVSCKHGTYVGTPHGADHICGWCEDGTEPGPVFVIVDSSGMPWEGLTEYDESTANGLVRALWAAGHEAYVKVLS